MIYYYKKTREMQFEMVWFGVVDVKRRAVAHAAANVQHATSA